jgi:HTH-type transcriptional repressor of NAD biosynthesis genes
MKEILTVTGNKIDPNAEGWLVGKFAPATTGHIYFISMAATLVKKLTVVMSYRDGLFEEDYLSWKKRLLYLKTVFKDIPHIEVKSIDETEVPVYPNGWSAWADLMHEVIPKDAKYVFSSEPSYTEGFNKYFPDCEHVVVDTDRNFENISATMVRNDPMKYWSYLPTIVRVELVKRVVVIGTESCGKSTLVKYLAKLFQSSWVEEYGRTFCEQNMCMDERLLSFDDYATIAAKRFEMEQEAARTANRILFADTNAFITNFYCKLYEGSEHPLVSQYEKLEKYDLVIFLEDDVEWVDDGLRINSDRDKTRKLMKEMLEERGTAVVSISGDYNQRFQKAADLCRELIAFKG